jgi:Uma2 family endonuclease
MPLPKKEYYTYEDYASWSDDQRWELIDGVPYLMSPAPLREHQRIQRNLTLKFASFLEGKPCEVFPAPFDVRLNANSYNDTVVQPDLVVICDKSKHDEKGGVGAPDMVIEILAPSTSRRDRFTKFNLYLRYGVKEYWIVDPDAHTVEVFLLTGDAYVRSGYGDTETNKVIEVKTLLGLSIDLAEIFATV